MDLETPSRLILDKAGGEGTAAERDDAAAILTYRYLRLGMVIIVIAMVASLAIQRADTSCWQGSISAYWYSPSRAIFVSGMVAIGVSLIVIKGSTIVEDVLLNIAGMLAPIVALVPTTFEARCAPGEEITSGRSSLSPPVLRYVENNLKALLIAGSAALVFALISLLVDRKSNSSPADASRPWLPFVLLLLAAGVVAIGWRAVASDEILAWHGRSAALMFFALALASIWNGVWLLIINAHRGAKEPTNRQWRLLAWSYIAIGGSMVAAGLLIELVLPSWDHDTLVLEMIEIGLFASMWVVQTFERWGKVTQPVPPPAAGG